MCFDLIIKCILTHILWLLWIQYDAECSNLFWTFSQIWLLLIFKDKNLMDCTFYQT